MWTAKTLISLGGWPGSSESSLGAHATLLVLLRGGSVIVYDITFFLSYNNTSLAVENITDHLELGQWNIATVRTYKNERHKSLSMAKTFKTMCAPPAKTQISLHVYTVWSVFARSSLGSQRPMASSNANVQADLSLCWARHFPALIVWALSWQNLSSGFPTS